MRYIELLTLSLFDVFMLIIIILSFEGRIKKDICLKKILYLLFGTILISLSGYFISNKPIALIVNTTITFLIIKIFTNKKIQDILLIYIFTLVIVGSSQLLVIVLMNLFINKIEFTFVYGIVSQVISTIIVLVIVKVVPLKSIHFYIAEENKWFKRIIINLFAILYVILMLWYTNLSGFLEAVLALLIIGIVILIVNVIIINNAFRNENLLGKVQIYDTYFPIIEDMIKEIRGKQHDYHNHIQVLQSFVSNDNEKSDGFTKYKNQILKDNVLDSLIKMNNEILIAFLYSKYKDANLKGVKIEYVIDSFFIDTKFKEYELVEIYGVLIDNALEATIEIKEKDFQIFIGYEDGMNIIKIKNKTKELTSKEINKMFEYKYSTKNNKDRGIGLYKLQKLLKKNNGTITVCYDTDKSEIEFTVRHF